MEEEVKITFGGWYQRTSLHLTEIYDFLSKCESRLPLSKEKLKEFHKDLNLKFATKETGNLDFVMAETKSGIEIRYYEDGLYILEIKKTKNIESSVKLVKNYFENFFNPAINYLFSLGAPTPKILSDIKEPHQIVITKFYEKHSEFDVPQKYGKVYSKTTSENVSVYKTPEYIFVVGARNEENLASIVEMQIFFREFKSQLHKYLGIHREIWEEISEIKERKFIKGKDVEFYRVQLEIYKKTIDLINNRINQMPSYAHTRASLAKTLDIEKQLLELFQYKFEDLSNTHSYIKEIWSMTRDYVSSAISVLVEVANKSNVSGIKSIQILASIGVFVGIISYLTKDTLPKFSKIGLFYFLILIGAVILIDFLIKFFTKNKKYELKFPEKKRD
ncbi:MAG TPA: hypothetical protein VJA20_02350 [Candidatus Nanoarchaeia archaeon]|nr:hypothetical protein [Candidatus Nanoarchaeia archaeon]